MAAIDVDVLSAGGIPHLHTRHMVLLIVSDILGYGCDIFSIGRPSYSTHIPVVMVIVDENNSAIGGVPHLCAVKAVSQGGPLLISNRRRGIKRVCGIIGS